MCHIYFFYDIYKLYQYEKIDLNTKLKLFANYNFKLKESKKLLRNKYIKIKDHYGYINFLNKFHDIFMEQIIDVNIKKHIFEYIKLKDRKYNKISIFNRRFRKRYFF